MIWYVWPLIGSLLSGIWSLSVKKGLGTMIGADFESWYGIVSLVILVVFNIIQKIPFTLNKPGLISGLFGGLTIIALTESMKKSPNPGMSMAVYRSQAVLTTVLAFLVFDSHISAQKIIAMIVVLLGVYVLSTDSSSHHKESNHHEEESIYQEESKHKKGGLNWVQVTLIAIIVGSLSDLTIKGAMNNESSSFDNVLFNVFLMQTIIFVVYDRYKTGNFKLQDINKDKKVDIKDIGITLWTGIIYFMVFYVTNKAIKTAPNVGYAKAIATFGVVITTVCSHYLFDSVLTKRVALGIFLIISGISYIAMG